MSLKLKYFLFIAVIHGVLLFLIFHLYIDRKWIFICAEALVLISLYLSFLLYKSFIKPINLLQSGSDAIADADFSIKYIKTGAKEIDKLIEVYNAMIDRLRIERTTLSEQSHFIQKLIEITPIGIIILDYDHKISNLNPAAKKILNIKENLKGIEFQKIKNPLANKLQKITDSKPIMLSTNGINKFKCQVNNIIHQGFKRKFILIDDLSSELLKSEKDAYGKIIRMMAHEVNNSMGAINSILDTVIDFGLQEQEKKDLKDALIIAKDRNSGLSDFIARYASILRLPKPQLIEINLHDLVNKIGKLFVPKLRKNNITIHYNFENKNQLLLTDPILLEQAISNIVKNAIEAIGENGQINIECTSNPTTLIIADNGSGISEETKEKLFTPFFSSKPNGQGVGLMIIREILQKLNTDFSLESNQKNGLTEFRIEF